MQTNTKDKIVNAAIELFAENGYTETSMKDIANVCHMKPASIYYYFDSKMKILEEIIGMYAGISKNKIPFITEEFVKEENPDTVLHQLFFKFDEDTDLLYRQIIKIFLQEQYRIDEIRNFMKTKYIEATQSYIKDILDRMVEYGKISPINTEMFAEILHSVNIKSTITSGHYLNDPDALKKDKWEETLDFVINLIVNHPFPPAQDPAVEGPARLRTK